MCMDLHTGNETRVQQMKENSDLILWFWSFFGFIHREREMRIENRIRCNWNKMVCFTLALLVHTSYIVNRICVLRTDESLIWLYVRMNLIVLCGEQANLFIFLNWIDSNFQCVMLPCPFHSLHSTYLKHKYSTEQKNWN